MKTLILITRIYITAALAAALLSTHEVARLLTHARQVRSIGQPAACRGEQLSTRFNACTNAA